MGNERIDDAVFGILWAEEQGGLGERLEVVGPACVCAMIVPVWVAASVTVIEFFQRRGTPQDQKLLLLRVPVQLGCPCIADRGEVAPDVDLRGLGPLDEVFGTRIADAA